MAKLAIVNPWNYISVDRVNSDIYLSGYAGIKADPTSIGGMSWSYKAGRWDKEHNLPPKFSVASAIDKARADSAREVARRLIEEGDRTPDFIFDWLKIFKNPDGSFTDGFKNTLYVVVALLVLGIVFFFVMGRATK